MRPRSFLATGLPLAANLATAPRGVDFEAWTPVGHWVANDGATVAKTQLLRPYPEFGTFSIEEYSGSDRYDALSLQLDVASRLSDGKAAAHVRQAHAITRLLLSDVRDVVGTLRETRPRDLAQAIRALGDGATGLSVHLELPEALPVEERAKGAETLLKSADYLVKAKVFDKPVTPDFLA